MLVTDPSLRVLAGHGRFEKKMDFEFGDWIKRGASMIPGGHRTSHSARSLKEYEELQRRL